MSKPDKNSDQEPFVGLRHDPVEDTPEFKRVIEKARTEVRTRLLKKGFDTEKMMGGCYLYWPALKEHLKTQYGIEWKTPEEMNPGCLFD